MLDLLLMSDICICKNYTPCPTWWPSKQNKEQTRKGEEERANVLQYAGLEQTFLFPLQAGQGILSLNCGRGNLHQLLRKVFFRNRKWSQTLEYIAK